MNLDLTPKTILISAIISLALLAFTYYKLNPKESIFNSLAANGDCSDDKGCYGIRYSGAETIGNCRNCIALAGLSLPHAEGTGEYIDVILAAKLKQLAKINANWRITEAYPPTVRHLGFCHENGTCSDIGLYPEKRSAKNLSQFCKDALKVGLTVVNEYSDPKLFSVDSACPPSNIFETTTGGHLHVQ